MGARKKSKTQRKRKQKGGEDKRMFAQQEKSGLEIMTDKTGIANGLSSIGKN